ncbi:hypothetical protein OAT37_03175, partial [Alphaproteobacteria bacterium]|nr:hypothetical protein [Alphaproteobacteria bacterium]
FRADEKDGIKSIETAMKNCETERLILIEAALRFEQNWRQYNPDKIENVTEKDGGYIPFSDLCLDSEARKWRDAALHGKVKKFCACPSSLSKYIKAIVEARAKRAKKYSSKR